MLKVDKMPDKGAMPFSYFIFAQRDNGSFSIITIAPNGKYTCQQTKHTKESKPITFEGLIDGILEGGCFPEDSEVSVIDVDAPIDWKE